MGSLEKLATAYRITSQEGLSELIGASRTYFRSQLKDQLVMECEGTTVTFDTSTTVAKKWFFPGHIDGQLHEPALTRQILAALEPDTVFYDLGANLGYYTLFASEVCREGSVHAFELDGRFIRAIEKSLAANGTEANVVHGAVSDTVDDRVHYTDEITPSVDASGTDSNSVTSVTLDDYALENPLPTVMKVDVEGFELAALRGARETIERADELTVFVEVHPDRLTEYGHSAADVLSLLDDHGFGYRRLANHRSDDSVVQNEVDPESLTDNTVLVCTL